MMPTSFQVTLINPHIFGVYVKNAAGKLVERLDVVDVQPHQVRGIVVEAESASWESSQTSAARWQD